MERRQPDNSIAHDAQKQGASMSKRRSLTTANAASVLRKGSDPLLADLRQLIEQARQAASASAPKCWAVSAPATGKKLSYR
jgi:hypothetical protein